MSPSVHTNKQPRKPVPILARHAISLSLAFALALVLSYFASQALHRHLQLGKLTSPDRTEFDRGVGYVLTYAGSNDTVTQDALVAIETIDPPRAADLLLAIAQSHAKREDVAEPTIPDAVQDAIAPLMDRLIALQAIGLYDGLTQIRGIDPDGVADGLLASLETGDDAELLQIVDLLDTRLLWSKEQAPLELWLQWLGILVESQNEDTQFNVARHLGNLPEAVDNPRVTNALTKLANSKHETVRNAALHAAAGYAAIAQDPASYEQIILTLTQDKNKHIARRAWMVVGHLKPSSQYEVNWRDVEPFVAEAMLWAAAKTDPISPTTLEAYETDDYKRSSIFALSLLPKSEGEAWTEVEDRLFFDYIASYRNRPPLSESDRQILARLLLAAPPFHALSFDILEHTAAATVTQPENGYESALGLTWEEDSQVLLAAAYYTSGHFRFESPLPAIQSAIDLAHIEGMAHSRIHPDTEGRDIPIPLEILGYAAGFPVSTKRDRVKEVFVANRDLLVFTTAASMALIDDKSLISEIANELIAIRQSDAQLLAAMLDSLHHTGMTFISGLTADLLRQHPDLTDEQLRAMTDVELADLGLSRIDALPALLDAAQAAPASAGRETEAKLLKLALWMRGDYGEDFTPTAEAMFFDDDLPTSTVLMCLLHMQRPIALDYLFGDLVTPRPDLHKLFIQERYWHVFRRFVDTEDLTLWLWGDPEAQGFQLEAMRQWYAVNKWRVAHGWWPAPGSTPETDKAPGGSQEQ